MGKSRKRELKSEEEVVAKVKGKRNIIYVDERDCNSASPSGKRNMSGKKGKKHGKVKVRYVYASSESESESDTQRIVVKRRSKHRMLRRKQVSDSEEDDSIRYDVGVKRKKRYVAETETEDSSEDEVVVKKRSRKNVGGLSTESKADRRECVSVTKIKRKKEKGDDKRSKETNSEGCSYDVLSRRNVVRPNNGFGAVTKIVKDTYYRSNIQGAITRINTLDFNEGQLHAIKRTPFWCLFNAIYKKESEDIFKSCHKYEQDIRQIVDTFDVTTEKFVIGGRMLALTRTDVELIFGISCGDVEIVLKKDMSEKPDWLMRCFGERIMDKSVKFVLYRNLIFEKMLDLLNSTTREDIEDCARLLNCYLLASILAPLQNGSISWQLTCFMAEFDKICIYDWSGFVVRLLKDQLKSTQTMKAGGCTIILPFWLCEHTQIIKRDIEVSFPRFLHWNTNNLHKVLLRVELPRITKVYKACLHISKTEMEVLLELKMFRDSLHLEKERCSGEVDDRGNSEYVTANGDEEMRTAPSSEAVNFDKQKDDAQGSPIMGFVQTCSEPVSNVSKLAQVGELGVSTPPFSLGLTQYIPNIEDGDAMWEKNQSERLGFSFDAMDGTDSSNMRGSNKTENVIVDEQLIEKSDALRLQVEQVTKEMDDSRLRYEATLKNRDETIVQIRSENSELLRRLSVLEEGPTTTQLYENQAVMAQLDASEKLAILKEENKQLMGLISELTRKAIKVVSPIKKNDVDCVSKVDASVSVIWEEGGTSTKAGVVEEKSNGCEAEKVGLEDEEIERVLETQHGNLILYNNPENLERLKESLPIVLYNNPDNTEPFKESFEVLSPMKSSLCFDDAVKSDMENEKTPIDKRRGVANEYDPKSLIKRVKVRTDRKKVPTSPQLNTGEIITLHEGYTEEDIARDMELLNANKKNPLDMSIGAVKRTGEDVRDEIAFFCITKGNNHVVFRGVQPSSEVTIESLLKILHNQRLSSGVIDSWCDLVQKRNATVSCPVQHAMIFSSLCWELISKCNGPKNVWFDALIENRFAAAMDMETLVFPILAGGEQSTIRGVGDHWTLLKLHVPKSKWTFYNSMKPRGAGIVDQHYKQSLIVVRFVDKKLREIFKKNRPSNKFLMRPLVMPTIEKCAQQDSGSLDCGVVVCNNVEKMMKGKPLLTGEFTLNAAAYYRAKMATWFMES